MGIWLFLSAILFLIPLACSIHTYDSFVLPKTALFTAGILLVLAWRGFDLVRGRKLGLRLSFPLKVCFLLVCVSTLSAFAADPPTVAFLNLMPIITGALLMLLLSSVEPSSRPPLRLFLWAIFLASFIESLYVLSQSLGLDPLSPLQHTLPGRWRLYGTLGNPNRVAWFISTASVMMVAHFVASASKREKWVMLVILGFSMSAILLTQSRGSIVALVGIMGLLMVFLRFRTKSGTYKVVALFLGLLISVSTILLVAFPGHFGSHFKDTDSIRGRLIHWIATGELLKQHPLLGVGPGNFALKFPSAIESVDERTGSRDPQLVFIEHVHNEYLETAIETGLPGLLLFLLLIFSLAQQGMRVAPCNPAVMPFLSGFAQICFISFYDFPLREPTTSMIFWISAGVLAAVSGPESEIKLTLRPVLQKYSMAGIVVSCLAGLYIFSVRLIIADMHYLSSFEAHQAGDKEKALSEVRTALTFAPYKREYRMKQDLLLQDTIGTHSPLEEILQAGRPPGTSGPSKKESPSESTK